MSFCHCATSVIILSSITDVTRLSYFSTACTLGLIIIHGETLACMSDLANTVCCIFYTSNGGHWLMTDICRVMFYQIFCFDDAVLIVVEIFPLEFWSHLFSIIWLLDVGIVCFWSGLVLSHASCFVSCTLFSAVNCEHNIYARVHTHTHMHSDFVCFVFV